MKVITCASYYGTGSSAVTDFFSEFDHICSFGNYEYRFLQEPDGVSDLEYNIVENNHRHNTSDAIKRFIRYTHSLITMGYGGYDIFDGKFEEITSDYIKSIVQLKTHTWWNKDRISRGKLFVEVDRVYSLLKRIATGTINTEKRYSLLQKTEWGYYTAISEEEFLLATKKYIRTLMQTVNKKNLPFVMVDQMVPPTNTKRYQRYFDDVKIIVVDRDPRDIFLLEREFWQWGVIPVKNVREYVQWFKITRKYAKDPEEDPDHVLRIKFEDMVYKYDETTEKLMQFVGIDPSFHKYVKTKFDPSISIKNINLKQKVKGYEKEIKYIEKNLKEYLYNY